MDGRQARNAVRQGIIHLVLPVIGIAVILYAAIIHNIPFGSGLGLRWPDSAPALVFSIAFLALALCEEAWLRYLDIRPAPWRLRYSAPIIVIRGFAIVVLAPILEELLFRGLIYYLISNMPMGEAGAIVITAALFTAGHSWREPRVVPVRFVHGLFYGAVRYFTGSTVLCMIFHSVGNMYAVWERNSSRGAPAN